MGNNQEQTKKIGLLDKNVDVEPVGVMYNVTGQSIEDFVYNYLTQLKKIRGISAVRASVVKEGDQKPEVAMYVFISKDSPDLASNMRNIPKHLANKMDEGSYRLSDGLFDALKSICRDFKINSVSQQGLVYVKLNIFKVLALMFSATPKQHNIAILAVRKLKKRNCVISMLKSIKYPDKDEVTSDTYADIIDQIED